MNDVFDWQLEPSSVATWGRFEKATTRYRVVPRNSATTKEIYVKATDVIFGDEFVSFYDGDTLLMAVYAGKVSSVVAVNEDGLPLDEFASGWIE